MSEETKGALFSKGVMGTLLSGIVSIVTIASTDEFQAAMCVASAEFCLPYKTAVVAAVGVLTALGIYGRVAAKKEVKGLV